MKHLGTIFLLVVALALSDAAAAVVDEALPGGALPGDSVYQLDIPLINQDARASKLAELRGTPVLIAMFYTSCKYVCPLIVDSMRSIDKSLADGERARLRVVLVSFDPEHDTPQALKSVADERHLELPRWSLDRTDADSVRKLAAVLGIQYRAIEKGDFNHSTVISLLDKDGRIVAHSSRTGELDADLLAATKRELATH
jgi:protein SCO1/2